MPHFIKNPTEVVLCSIYSQSLYFYMNKSTSLFNRVVSGGGIGCSLIVTTERIVYSPSNLVKIFNVEWAKSLGLYGFEIKKEQIINSFRRNVILTQEYVFQTNAITFGIEVGYFSKKNINAIEKFLNPVSEIKD